MFKSGMLLAISQLIVLACVPILSRAYDLNQFADFAVFFTFYTIGSALSNFRLSDALVKEEERFKPFLVSLIVLISIVVSILFSVLYGFYKGSLNLEVVILFLAIFLYSVTRVFYFSDVSRCFYPRASFWLSSINVLTVLMQIVFSSLEGGLCFGLVVALLLTVLLQIVIVKLDWEIAGWSVYRTILEKNEGYTKYLTFYSLIGGLRNRMIYFFLGQSALGGVLNQFEKVSNAPNTLVSSVVRPVVFSRIKVCEFKNTEYVVGGLLVVLFSLVSPFLILVSEYSENIVLLVFGEQWLNYHSFFSVICSIYLIYMCVNWMDRIFDIVSRQKVVFKIELAVCLFGLVGFQTLGYFELYEYMVYYHLGMVLTIIGGFFVFVYCQFGDGFKHAVRRLVLMGLIFVLHYVLYLSSVALGGSVVGTVVFLCLAALITLLLTLRMRVWDWIKESL